MREYEIVKETFNPCAGDQRPDQCEILELEIADPAAYVQEQYRNERTVNFLTLDKDGSLVIEALFEGGRKHRYTFSEL